MSNEYIDWMMDKIEEEKEMVKIYPFLQVRDIDGTIDEKARFPMIPLEIPDGWYKLFFQMCEDIKPLLEQEDVLDKFYFIQVKEKYNELICYSNGVASLEVEQIIQKYKYISRYVCTNCGKPAEFETTGYLASYCNECRSDKVSHHACNVLKFVDTFELVRFARGQHRTYTIDVSDEWNRYSKGLN